MERERERKKERGGYILPTTNGEIRAFVVGMRRRKKKKSK